MNYDFLIVGQGITGSIVALQLKKNSKKIKLIDGGGPIQVLRSQQELSILSPLKGAIFHGEVKNFMNLAILFIKKLILKAVLSSINPINY